MRYLLYTISLFMFMTACKSTQLAKPAEEYNDPLEEKTSILNIPLRIGVRELEKSLNEQLKGTLYEDKDLKDGDKMMLRATKKEDFSLSIDSQKIIYRVPLNLWMLYDAGITNIEATGDMALTFETLFNIQPDWSLNTTTSLTNHEWIKKPVLKVGLVNLPAGFIADLIIKNGRQTIAKAIDDQIKENLDLKTTMSDAWKKMFEPVLVSPEYNTWLTINPQSIGMSRLILDNDTLQSNIIIESKPRVNLGVKPGILPASTLPDFLFKNPADKSFFIYLNTEIPFKEAERIVQDNLIGETFTQGKYSATVEGLEMYGQGNKLIVNTKLSGSYNGSIYLTGKPTFDPRKNTVDIEDLKFTVETRNFLLKSASWLLKSTIRNQIENNLNFLLAYNMTELQKQFQSRLDQYAITKGTTLQGSLDKLAIHNAYLAPDAFKVQIVLNGNAILQVNGLN